MCTRFRLAVLIVALGACAPGTWAAEGRVPIYQQTVLDHNDGPISGKYVVTRNVLIASGRVIDIIGSGVEDIELDLNGFTLRTGSGILLHADGVRTLIIRNGLCQMLGGGDNIRVRNTERLIVEGVNATGGRYGIFVDVGTRAFIVRNNTITDVLQNGIIASTTLAEADPEISDGLIEANLVQGPGERGIEARFGFLTLAIVANRIDNAGTYGITVNSSGATTVSDNKINGAGYRGLIVNRTTSCRVSGNVVKGAGVMLDATNGSDGIDIGDRAENCLVLNNTSSDNMGSGIRVRGDANTIEGNVANANGRAGLHFTSEATLNTFGRNTARANGTLGALPFNCVSNPGGSTALAAPDFCDESASPTTNTSFGDNLAPGPPIG